MTGDAALRAITPEEWPSRRFQWMEAVRLDSELSDRAARVAQVLALDFANHRTGECFAGPAAIAKLMGRSPDSVKRSLGDLEAAGWIVWTRRSGAGRGNLGSIDFLSRARIVELPRSGKGGKVAPLNRPIKGGSSAGFSGREKGAEVPRFGESEKGAVLPGKGGSSAFPPTPPYKDKPYSNHKGDADGSARFWAEQITAERYVPVSALTNTIVDRMLALKLVERTALERLGVVPRLPSKS
ncbi:helix-turn-helix domain-containing protein [Pseudoroseicyclus sp. H15]